MKESTNAIHETTMASPLKPEGLFVCYYCNKKIKKGDACKKCLKSFYNEMFKL